METKSGIFSILVPKARLLSSTGGPLGDSSLSEIGDVEKRGKFSGVAPHQRESGFQSLNTSQKNSLEKIQKGTFLEPHAKDQSDANQKIQFRRSK